MDTPYQFEHRVSRDSDEHADFLAEWDQTYNQLTAGPFEGELTQVWFDGLQIFRERTNRAVKQSGRCWDGSRVIAVPVRLEGVALFSRRLLTPDALLSFRGDEGFTLDTPEHFDVVGIALPESLFAHEAQTCGIEPGRHAAATGPRVFGAAAQATSALRELLVTICDRPPHDPAPFGHRAVQRTLRSTLLGHVADLLESAAPSDGPTRSFGARSRIVHDAIEFALADPGAAVSVADLCGRLRISRRLLNQCFQDVLGTNPVAYLRSLRLNAVRRQLRLSNGTPVREIAYAWGFWHLPRFACEYKALFGELPSATQRRRIAGPH